GVTAPSRGARAGRLLPIDRRSPAPDPPQRMLKSARRPVTAATAPPAAAIGGSEPPARIGRSGEPSSRQAATSRPRAATGIMPEAARRRRRVRSRAGAAAAPPVREIAAIDVPLLPQQLQSLFDPLPDVVFFVKDADCRYAHVNQTLIQRLGLPRREDILGKSVLELYPASLSATYIAQDRRVLAGEVIENLLELQLYPNRMRGWCLTFKQPLYQDGRIAGLIGIS